MGYCLKSVEDWHRYIDDKHIRIEALHFEYCVPTILDGAHNFEFFTQYQSFPRQNLVMVVGEQYSNFSGRCYFSFLQWVSETRVGYRPLALAI